MKQNFAYDLVLHSNKLGDKIAISSYTKQVSYKELSQGICSVAGFLKEKNILPEQRVIIALENCPEWPMLFFGCVLAGVVPVPISTNYNKKDYNYIVELIEPTTVIDSNTDLNEWLNHSPINDAVYVHPDSLAFITMTSGSTNHAKAVMHGHSRFYNFIQLEADPYYQLTVDSVVLAMPKFYFAWGLSVGVICPLMKGSRVIIGSPNLRVLQHQIEKEHVDTIFAVPSIARLLATQLKNNRPIRVFLAGETPSKELLEALYETFKLEPLVSIGMSEVGSYCANTIIHNTPGTLGRHWFNGAIKIVNDENELCDVLEHGEIYISTANPTLGYWRNLKATQDTYQGKWVRTRDLGYIDQDQNLIVKGRVGDCFKINGILYYASDIEKQIMQHPMVTDCAVISVPNNNRLNLLTILAYVCSTSHLDSTKKEISNLVDVINLKAEQIQFIDSIPVSVTQKKIKYQLIKDLNK